MESARGADYCVLVTEPTAFGLHDLRLVAELMRVMKKRCGVVVNKSGAEYPELERFLAGAGLPVLARIPYSAELARICSQGRLAYEEDAGARELFDSLLGRIEAVSYTHLSQIVSRTAEEPHQKKQNQPCC